MAFHLWPSSFSSIDEEKSVAHAAPTWLLKRRENLQLAGLEEYENYKTEWVMAPAAAGGCTVSVENTIEVFSPPYLFNSDGSRATRPSIVSIDGVTPTNTVAPTVHRGATFAIETPEAADIAKVVLLRPTAITHNTDTEQRAIHCTFTKTGANTVSAVAPDGIHPHAMAPRGYYMLFILNTQGVPTQGKFIHLH